MTYARDADREGQRVSAFTFILERLVGSCVGCQAAVLVDHEGEAVDYAGELPPYEAKLAGAHWQIVLRELFDASQLHVSAAGDPRSVAIRTATRGFLLHRVFGDYVLIVVCEPLRLETISDRALSQAEHELRHEAGWTDDERGGVYWQRVRVACDAHGSPARLSTHDTALAPIVRARRFDEVARFERGYRVQTAAGHSLVVVREPSGFWYARDDADVIASARST